MPEGTCMNARSRLSLGLAMLACSVVLVSPAMAEPHGLGTAYRVKHLGVVSGPTPFPNGCPGAFGDDAHIAGYEGEPSIAVNPRKPHTILVSWMQDLGPEGVAARSDVIASSHNVG